MRVYPLIAIVFVVAQSSVAFGSQPIVKQALPSRSSESSSEYDSTKDLDESEKEDRKSLRKDAKKDSTKASPLGGNSIFGDAPLPVGESGSLRLPKLTTPSTDLSSIGTGSQPKDNAGKLMSEVIALPEGGDRAELQNLTNYQWHASNTFSHPLYFEDAMLERHGQELCWPLTPLYSGVRFFAALPALPYLMTVQRPCECNYSLGHWRAGSRAPCLHQRPPWQRDAALVEAASLTGAFLIFP